MPPKKKCAGINFNTREKGGVVGPSVYPKEVRVLFLIPVWQRRSLAGGRCAPSSAGIIFNTRVMARSATTKGRMSYVVRVLILIPVWQRRSLVS